MRDKKDIDVYLIELVRSYPQLYDKSHAEYKNQVKKTKIWREIGTESGFKGSNFILLIKYTITSPKTRRKLMLFVACSPLSLPQLRH